MTEVSVQRCIRCHMPYTNAPHLMAGRAYCCASCAVGSACEHQRVHRAANVRRYDSTFKPCRRVVRHSTPYEPSVPERD